MKPAPSSIEIPALRVPRYRLAPVDCILCSSVTGKLPVLSYPRLAPFLTLPTFATEPDAAFARLRRLHLIIVDLQHPKRVASQAEKDIYQQMLVSRDGWTTNTRPIPLKAGENWRCRYAFGYGLDDSDLPCFLLWPERTNFNCFGVLDCSSGTFYDLRATPSIENLGL